MQLDPEDILDDLAATIAAQAKELAKLRALVRALQAPQGDADPS